MIKKLGIFLIILGLILISTPLVSQLVMDYRLKEGLKTLADLSADQLRDNNELEHDFDWSSVTDITPKNIIQEIRSDKGSKSRDQATSDAENSDQANPESSSNPILKGINDNYKHAIIGHLVVDAIDINLPILKGTTANHLMIGATTMKADQVMGQGNYSLSGHYHSSKGVFFHGLLEAQPGMIIKITDKDRIYEYEIYDTMLVEDTATHLINDQESQNRGKPIISLMTCYYTSANGLRFFALGELVDDYPFEIGKMLP